MTDKPMTLAEQNKVLRNALRLAMAALESCRPGDTSTGHVIDPSFDEDAVNAAGFAVEAALALPVEEDKDGERWRRFRALHWSEDGICAVLNPKQSVRLGGMCPSGEHLDSLVDALPPIERAHGIQGKEG